MIFLKGTNETLELATSSVAALDVHVSFIDILISSMDMTGLSSQESAITTATTTTILAAPAAGTTRQIKMLNIENRGSVANSIIIKKDIGGTEYYLETLTLQPGESIIYTDRTGFTKHNAAGASIMMFSTDKASPITAQSQNLLKVGAANKAAGVLHFLGLSSGQPGAWAPGTPGLNGRATDGTAAGDAGCVPIKNPSSGANYITMSNVSATVACMAALMDILWVNSGLVVTTLTAQAITPVAIPARDRDGLTDGVDVMAGLLVTTATTNAGAISNITISYTNSDGVAGRTGTMASFPITANAGTIVLFQLQAGDKGVRSVQSVTIGTSLVTGAVSLILFRTVALVPQLLANAGGMAKEAISKVRIFNNACILPYYIPTTTTALTLFGLISVEEY